MSEKPDKKPGSGQKPRRTKIKAPRGTRDLYPAEAARRRWLMERWREVSIRHGFEEVDGPTYEEADLYAVKSGEGILGELFQAFSGKSPEEVERVKRDGRAGYALRPEFTPTLARMYAAKANTLPKPCKWFMAGPFFRAERPQRGRLREFLQWNVDVLGLDVPQEKWYAEDAESRAEVAEAKARMDAECIACVAVFCEQLGFTPEGDVRIHISDRSLIMSMLHASGVTNDDMEKALALLDRRNKLDQDAFVTDAEVLGLNIRAFDELLAQVQIDFAARVDRAHLQHIKHTIHVTPKLVSELLTEAGEITEQDIVQTASESDRGEKEVVSSTSLDYRSLYSLCDHLGALGLREWVTFDPAIVRGLAYYTGTVFEVIADGERAVAGGGRYDNLIELFGGPPTPAVGFAMGDVVLSLLLQDKGLMPSDDELLGLVGQHPDVFVLSNGTAEAEAKVRQVVAMLRRGEEREEGALSPTLSHDHSHGQAREREQGGLHVRHSYKATKKVDKLLAEAKKQHARFAVILEGAKSCVVKDLHTGEQWSAPVALNELHTKLHEAL